MKDLLDRKTKSEEEVQNLYNDLLNKIKKYQNDSESLKSQLRISKLPTRVSSQTMLHSMAPVNPK